MSIQSLVTDLPRRDLESHELRELAARIAAEPAAWRHLVRFDREGRVCELLLEDDHVTVWLICWTRGQDTGFHDHDMSAGGVAVFEGAVREERLTLGGPPAEHLAQGGESFGVSAADIHRVVHAGGPPAVTVHAYSPPLRTTGSYVEESDGALRRYAHSEELRPLATTHEPA
jgi:predicted metal-dependent enzyme (double-stranded beta helix superfamily)